MSSPAVGRATRILDFLATHPERNFTLSALSRHLQISKATAHGVLASLVERGYLVREPSTQTYRLGPALIPLGTIAEETARPMAAARAEIGELADRLGVECSISVATAGEILIVAHAGVPHPMGITGHAGQRLPLVPPLGTVFLGWERPEVIDDWLAVSAPNASAEQLRRYRTALGSVRRRGYAMAPRVDAYLRLTDLYAESPHDIQAPAARVQVDELMRSMAASAWVGEDDVPDDADIAYLAAPVFNPEGRTELAMNMVPGKVSVRDAPELGEELRRAAGRVTAATHGRRPDLDQV